MKSRLKKKNGLLPPDMRGITRSKGVIKDPAPSGTGKAPYQAPLIEVSKVELENCIANDSARLKDTDSTGWKINDYTEESVSADHDIMLL